MRVVILGGGQVGYSIAKYLSIEHNSITVVDQSAPLLESLADRLDIKPVIGCASHPDVLRQADVGRADLLIAVTGSDEVNIVACQVAHCLFNVPHKIARIRQPQYLEEGLVSSSKGFAIDVVISPEWEVSKALQRSTEIAGTFDVISFATSLVKIVGIHCHVYSPVSKTPIRLLGSLFPKLYMVIVLIRRNNNSFVPTPDDVIEPDDEVYVLASSCDISDVIQAFSPEREEGRKILIIGGGKIGMSFAQKAQNKTTKIHLIEKDLDRSEKAATFLKDASVLRGDALDTEILLEADIENVETTLCVTNDDKVNILSALLAKRLGAKRVVCLLNNMHYSDLVTSLGVDSVINPHLITVSTILQWIRKGHILSSYILNDDITEIIEAKAQDESNIIGLSVSDINALHHTQVMAVIRKDRVFLLPDLWDIETDDILIIQTQKQQAQRIEKLFCSGDSYF